MPISDILTDDELKHFRILETKSHLSETDSRAYIQLRNRRLFNLLKTPLKGTEELERLQAQFLFDKQFGLGIKTSLNKTELNKEIKTQRDSKLLSMTTKSSEDFFLLDLISENRTAIPYEDTKRLGYKTILKFDPSDIPLFKTLNNQTTLTEEELNQYIELRDKRLFDLLDLFAYKKLNDLEKNELIELQNQFLFDKNKGLGIAFKDIIVVTSTLSEARKDLTVKGTNLTPAEKSRLDLLDKITFGSSLNLSLGTQKSESSIKTQIKPTAENKDPGLLTSMIQSFKNWFNKSPVKNEQGEHIFSFPSEAKAIEYCRKRAAKGMNFQLENEDKKVLLFAENKKIYYSEDVEFLETDKFFIAPAYRNRDKRLLDLLTQSNRTEKEKNELLSLQKDFLFGTDQSYRDPVNKLHDFDLGFPRNMTDSETKQTLIDKYLELRAKTNKSPQEEERFKLIEAIIINDNIQSYKNSSSAIRDIRDIRDKRLLELLNIPPYKRNELQQELENLQREFLFGTENSRQFTDGKQNYFDLGFHKDWDILTTRTMLNRIFKELEAKKDKSPEELNRLNIIQAIILNNDIQPYTKTATSPPSPNVEQQNLSYYVTESNRKFERKNFEHEENALEYCRDRANKKESFKLFNQEQILVAYSKGDGRVFDDGNNEIDSDATSFSPRAWSNKLT